MIEFIKDKVSVYETEKEKFNYLRELMQLMILNAIDELGYFKNIAFLGGTALRIIHRINRYSEDLDFSLFDKQGYDFDELLSKIVSQLELRNLPATLKKKRKLSAVDSCFIKFNELLYEVGLSPLKSQNLLIKFEIDTNPPIGFDLDSSFYNDELVFNICHFDLSSLFAGKLNAVLSRQYTKGRDFYDLLWYISRGIKPNLPLLAVSLEQMSKPVISEMPALKKALEEKISNLDFNLVKQDLEPFIIDKAELRFFDQEHFQALLRQFG